MGSFCLAFNKLIKNNVECALVSIILCSLTYFNNYFIQNSTIQQLQHILFKNNSKYVLNNTFGY